MADATVASDCKHTPRLALFSLFITFSLSSSPLDAELFGGGRRIVFIVGAVNTEARAAGETARKHREERTSTALSTVDVLRCRRHSRCS